MGWIPGFSGFVVYAAELVDLWGPLVWRVGFVVVGGLWLFSVGGFWAFWFFGVLGVLCWFPAISFWCRVGIIYISRVSRCLVVFEVLFLGGDLGGWFVLAVKLPFLVFWIPGNWWVMGLCFGFGCCSLWCVGVSGYCWWGWWVARVSGFGCLVLCSGLWCSGGG